jgi:hypothetical protein
MESRDADLIVGAPARVTVELPPELRQRSPYTILGTLTFVLDRGEPQVHLVHHRRPPAGRADPRRRAESRVVELAEFLGLVAEVEEVYREWPSVWRRYGTEHALEVELGKLPGQDAGRAVRDLRQGLAVPAVRPGRGEPGPAARGGGVHRREA